MSAIIKRHLLDSDEVQGEYMIALAVEEPESDVIEANALRFRERDYYNTHVNPTCLINSEPFDGRNSVVFSAMQFALWTNPKTIYLVGCDCSEGYFDGQASQFNASHLVSSWIQLKEFAGLYYPETKILSINPVGLKGVFDER